MHLYLIKKYHDWINLNAFRVIIFGLILTQKSDAFAKMSRWKYFMKEMVNNPQN